VVILALFFAFTNGANDSGSLVATIIACQAATPRGGVIFASIVGFIGAIMGGSAIAITIQSIVGPNNLDMLMPYLLHRTKLEEKMLIERFGVEYEEYMKRSKRLIPFEY